MTSASPRLDKRRRTFVRLIGEIHHALNQALSEEKESRGLNKTKIARLLGLDRSAISKKFDGRHNMTLESLADLAFALDRPVKVSLPAREKSAGSNRPELGWTNLSAAPVLASMKDAELPKRGQELSVGAFKADTIGAINSLNAIGSGIGLTGRTANGERK